MAAVQGRFFVKKGQVTDKYGTNLAADVVPGGGHTMPHNQFQSLVQAMMKLGVIFSEQETVNFLVEKVGDP